MSEQYLTLESNVRVYTINDYFVLNSFCVLLCGSPFTVHVGFRVGLPLGVVVSNRVVELDVLELV